MSGRQGVIPNGNCAFIFDVGRQQGCDCFDLDPSVEVLISEVEIPEHLWKMDPNINIPIEEPYRNAPYLPIWTTAVLEVVKLPIMYNQMSHPITKRAVNAMLESTLPVFSETFFREGAYYTDYVSYPNETSAILKFPVFLDGEIVGTISFEIRWSTFISFPFPPLANLVDIFQDEYISNKPWIIAIVTASVFLFTSVVFLIYDMAVAQRQRKVLERANRTSAIVSSLFPTNVRDRLYREAGHSKKAGDIAMRVSTMRMQSFLNEGSEETSVLASEPIADLFPMAILLDSQHRLVSGRQEHLPGI
ncbi:hypothetical protein IV203_035999 [Nitzschia inconspicua]|uniref:Uncharacterized protein n=1 Tax=Nitzschia inconspicua TaxID=303405 RepID=A0A9K3LFE3_9STRA|nr:hypothetical protein IV203_035999 [Nitzschia inconspicua]